MIQEASTQRRVVMRGAMDTCCSLWAPILAPADVLATVAILERAESGDASSHRTESVIPESTEK